MSHQNLKSVQAGRVRLDQATRLGSQRDNLGEGLTCPAGAGEINFDIYGRPATRNTLPLTDAACSLYTGINAARYMQFETNHRPSLPPCAAGLRGAADQMGYGRDLMIQDLYLDVREPFRGNFVRHYSTPNNAPPQAPPPRMRPYFKRIQPWDMSMDANDVRYQG